MNIADILLPVSLHQTFAYKLTEPAVIGQRVHVDFGRSGTCVGLIVAIHVDANPQSYEYEIKPIIDLLEDFPIVNKVWWDVLHFASRYYAQPLGKALKNAFPKHLHDANALRFPCVSAYSLSKQGKDVLSNNALPKNATRQRKFLNYIHDNPSISNTEIKSAGFTKADQDKACNNSFISITETSPYCELQPVKSADYALNEEQRTLIKNITVHLDSFIGHLIEGVTGSGKTEVYIQLITQAIVDGGQVLLLVPEIGLTPQMLARFTERFGKRVATYHSGMTDNARRNVFLSAIAGDLPILIGTRSAIFVPMNDLRLILIDEEHDQSYKQHEGFLYHARDLALFRAHKLGINVVMGSATPSLESLHNVSMGKLHPHYLYQRATSSSLPKIHIVDRRGHSRENVIADSVLQQMRFTLQRGKQVLLFLNRRGFSPVMGCNNCDWRSDCPACSTYQTAHMNHRQLCCHHCGHTERLPLQCPQCQDSEVYFMGAGTEKLESQITVQFPHHRVLRLDRDNQSTAKQLDSALQTIHDGEVDIILGTQLVVKGHHFPNVTMVCVVDADSALFSHDFRAQERLYQQLIQVAGRAGREHSGAVYVQTNIPEHEIFHALVKQDYNKYAQTLLKERQSLLLPPYSTVTLIKASHKFYDTVLEYLRAVKTTLTEHAPQLNILGPAPLSVEKVNHRFQLQLWISADDKASMQKHLPLIKEVIKHYDTNNRFKNIIDVDSL